MHALRNYVRNVYCGLKLRRFSNSPLPQDANIVRVKMSHGPFVVVDSNEPEFGHVIHRHKTWEPHIVRLITENLRPGDVYVDIGANVGVMSFNAAKAVGPSGKVIAFEPDQANSIRFLQGVIANTFANVVLFSVALSNKPSVFSLTGSSNTYLISPENSNRLIQAIPGDYVLNSETRIDFIKIDIEGHEPFALKGIAQTLARHTPLVLCEFNPRCLKDHASIDPARFADELFSLTSAIEAIEHDGNRNLVKNAAELMALWQAKNREAVKSGLLPDGMLHFDLLFRANGMSSSEMARM